MQPEPGHDDSFYSALMLQIMRLCGCLCAHLCPESVLSLPRADCRLQTVSSDLPERMTRIEELVEVVLSSDRRPIDPRPPLQIFPQISDYPLSVSASLLFSLSRSLSLLIPGA